MNISYNWLKEYVNFDLTPDEVAAALTSIGLETGGVEEVQTIKGGLEGLVIGEVLTIPSRPPLIVWTSSTPPVSKPMEVSASATSSGVKSKLTYSFSQL